MITEQEYLNAIRIVNEYTNQVKSMTAQILIKTGVTKTPNEFDYNWNIYFPNMDVRLWNILKSNFGDRRICDITKNELLSIRGAGAKCWMQLHEIIGDNSKNIQ